jgi:hypothetical protein
MFDLAQLRRTTFIALMAMLVLALAPTVSKIIADERATNNMVEVCTTEGTKWLLASELGQTVSGGHDQGPSSLHGGDCPFCSLQTAKFLTSEAQSFAATPVASLLPPLFYQAPKPLFAWAHSRSRAPPSAS